MKNINNMNSMKIDLSKAFKEDDVLAYLYPAVDDFENTVPGTIESTVSGRTMTIPGNKKLVFQNACSEEVLDLLNQMNVNINRDEIIPLNIDPRLPGPRREVATIREVEKLFNKYKIDLRTVIGWQPFMKIDQRIGAIDQTTLYELNSKDYMKEWIPEKYLPQEFMSFNYAFDLLDVDYEELPDVFWMKLDSSSSGDGVRYVSSKSDFYRIAEERKDKNMAVILQENIEAEENICVNFILSSKREGKIIGYSQQATNSQGEFFGSKVTNDCENIDRDVKELIEEIILPRLNNLGRYGVGAIDILRDKETGKIKVIDPNLRFNASTNFLVDKINGNVGDKNILMFNARFDGTMKSFEKNIIPLVEQKLLRVLAMSKFDDTPELPEFSLQVGALYDQEESLQEVLEIIKRAGLSANIYNLINNQG